MNNRPRALPDIPNRLTHFLQLDEAMSKKKILIVEDNVFVRRLFEISLATDYELIEAATREDAWTKLHEDLPDLAFVDVGLNEAQGGLLLLDAMRGDKRFNQIPVAVISARSLPLDVQMAKDRGANAYLTKPFSAKQLMELACTLLLVRH